MHGPRQSRRHIRDARPAEDVAVALEAESHSDLGAWSGGLLVGRHPTAAQRGEHRGDGAESFRGVSMAPVRIACLGIAADDRQLQLLAPWIFELRGRAGTIAERVADLIERMIDARLLVEDAAYPRVYRGRAYERSRRHHGSGNGKRPMRLEPSSSHRGISRDRRQCDQGHSLCDGVP